MPFSEHRAKLNELLGQHGEDGFVLGDAALGFPWYVDWV